MSLVAEKPKRRTRRRYFGVGVVDRGYSWRIWWYIDSKRQFDTISKDTYPTQQNAFEEAFRRKVNGNINESTITFDEFMEKYAATKKDINPEPLTRYSGHFSEFLKSKGYDTRLKKISEDAIKEFLFDYLSNGHNSNGTKHAFEYLRQIFRAAVNKKIISIDPTKNVKRPRSEKKIFVLPSKEEVEKILRWFLKNEPLLFPCVYFQAMRGWRRDELRLMKISDIDLQRERIRVFHYKQKEQKEYALLKDDLIILNEHFILLRKLKLYEDDGCLFPTRTGGIKQKDVVRLKIKKAAKELGISKNLTNHIFRHYVVTRLKDEGKSEETIKSITGHKDTNTIRDFYTHATKEETNKALEFLRPDLGKEFKVG